MRELTPLEYLQVQARKQRARILKPPMVEPDGLCYAYERPKAAFYTEGKAYQALVTTQQRRAAEGNPQVEKRFYQCPHGHSRTGLTNPHFHLTSMSTEDFHKEQSDTENPSEASDVRQD